MLCTLDMIARERFDTHRHRSHQLTFAVHGLLTMGIDDGVWVVARSRALWIPAGVPHDVLAEGATTMVAVYFDPDQCPIRWMDPTVVDTSGLLGHLVEHLRTHLAPRPRRRVEAVLFDLLRPLHVARLDVPNPIDVRAATVATALQHDPADDRSLAQWGRHVGASGRTLARIFERDTGLGFSQWRTRMRIGASLAALGSGQRVAQVARHVGYATPSACVAAFRRTLGVAPGAYFSRVPET